MKVYNRLMDAYGNQLTTNELVADKASDKIMVVYAHTGVINDNGLKLNDDSLEVAREKYPLLVEHSDNRVEDVVGYISTTGKPNENGEFTGEMVFYDTPQGKHAKTLWTDEVYNELSVSYYIKEYDVETSEDGEEYLNVKSAILKEISIVSVGADRGTHEIKEPVDEEGEDEPLDEDVPVDDETVENEIDELNTLKLNFLKSLV